MSRRALALAPLFVATAAHAQAPGQFAEPPPGYYSEPAPVVVAPPPLPGQFSVGLNFQSAAFGNDSGSADFGGGSLALRFRGWRRVELEFSIGGGREQLNGYEGDLAYGSGTLALRYRFNQQDKFNWWLLGGFGMTTIARHDASDVEIAAAQRPHLAGGVGIEYRFTNFALQAEARAMALGKTDDERYLSDIGMPVDNDITGGTFSIGASYYFGL